MLKSPKHLAMTGPIHEGRRLAKLILERITVPFVYAGHIDLDEATLLITRSVVRALQGTGKAKALLGAHVSRSERWFHMQLKALRDLSDAGEASAEGANKGYQVMVLILERLVELFPEAASLDDIRRVTGLESWDMNDDALKARLELYVSLGVIERTEAGFYRAKSDLMVELPGEDQVEKIAERISWIPALAMSNLRGEGELGGLMAQLTPAALERARKRMRKAFAMIMADALRETQESNDPTLIVRAVIALGAVGESDGSE